MAYQRGEMAGGRSTTRVPRQTRAWASCPQRISSPSRRRRKWWPPGRQWQKIMADGRLIAFEHQRTWPHRKLRLSLTTTIENRMYSFKASRHLASERIISANEYYPSLRDTRETRHEIEHSCCPGQSYYPWS